MDYEVTDTFIQACKQAHDKSPVPFAVARIIFDDDGAPLDFEYLYLNEAMASITGQTVKEMLGKRAYDMWGKDDETWLTKFHYAVSKNEAVQFEQVSAMVNRFFSTTAYPVADDCFAFIILDESIWLNRSNETKGDHILLFYDFENDVILLPEGDTTPWVFSSPYLKLAEFATIVFGADCEQELEAIRMLPPVDGHVSIEKQNDDGVWAHVTFERTGTTNAFAMGILEDISRHKEEERLSRERSEIITALSRENYATYLINARLDAMTPYRLFGDLPTNIYRRIIEGKSYSQGMTDYINTYVHPDYREALQECLSLERIAAEITDENDSIARAFLRFSKDGEAEFVQVRVLPLNGCGDDYILAFRDINESVKESHRQRDLLNEALKMSENANRAKSVFLANMSHDFRTPMNAISGFAEIARKNIDDPERVKDCLMKISRSSTNLLNLINDILDVSSLESGKLSTNEAPLDLRTLMDDMQAMFQGQAETRNIAYTVSISKLAHPGVYGDEVRLNQILVNLIGNAMKFTAEGGYVDVSLRELPNAPSGYGTYVFTVTDNGVGMSEDFIEHIWEPFARDKQNIVQRTEGTGLGMPITKNLVDMMNGAITLESKLGMGTTFRIQLPLKLQENAAGADEPGTTTSANRNAKGEEEPPDRRHYRGRTVLIVDDDDLSREILAETLKEYGLHIDEASNGREGVEAFAAAPAFHYSAVLMDMHMPLLDGDEATRAIRALDRDDVETVPIIATTADAFDTDRTAAMEAGMNGFLTKPYSARKLIETLDEFLGVTPPKTDE